MESHKRLLSILHIIYGGFYIAVFFVIQLVFDTILPFIENEAGEDFQVVQMVFSLIKSVFFILLFIVPLPSVIGAIAQLNGKKWGMTFMLVSGCISLLSVPLGTALGIYTLWVYLENQKLEKLNDATKG